MTIRKLLDKETSEDYVDECTSLLAKERPLTKEPSEVSVVIFRLAQEWLALSTHVFNEVSELRIIHRIPHSKNKVLLGIVNIQGQLKVCVSLKDLLEIENIAPKIQKYAPHYPSTIVTRFEENTWVFPVDQLIGIYQFNAEELTDPPITITKSNLNYIRGVFQWNNEQVGYLDEELLFSSLKRSLQ